MPAETAKSQVPQQKPQRRIEKTLSAAFIRTVIESGKYFDGQGLFLRVEPSGSRRWIQRTSRPQPRRDSRRRPMLRFLTWLAFGSAVAVNRRIEKRIDPKEPGKRVPKFARTYMPAHHYYRAEIRLRQKKIL